MQIQSLPTTPPENWDEKQGKKEIEHYKEEIARLQNILMAGGEKSLLIILQGMDASGKDSTVKKVLSAMNPMGMKAFSFKKPTSTEMSYDFLWRIHQVVPPKGMVHIFNRSHYEDILIQRVHRWIDEDTVQKRINAINSFEQMLVDNGTVVLKFFMNISNEQQLIRLNERTADPEKYWKHNQNDFEERKHWDAYMNAYEAALNECNTIPWIAVPCDDKKYKEYTVAKATYEALNALNLQFPLLKHS